MDRYENDPFNLDTMEEGERLAMRTNWHTLLNNMDIKHSSSKAWEIINKLNCDPTRPKAQTSTITANQVGNTSIAHKWKDKKSTIEIQI